MRRPIAIGSLLCALPACGQLVTIAGTGVFVEGGAQLTVQGDVLAAAAAGISNAGTVEVSGDLVNNSGGPLFAPVQGALVLNGASQQIAGSDVARVDALDLQCASLTLQQDLEVGGYYAAPSGTMALNASMVDLNRHALTITNPSTGAITRTSGQLVSETDPVVGYGTLEWRIGNGSGAYVVPFGDGINYLPVTLDITVPGNGSGYFVFATYPTDPTASPNNRPLPSWLPGLVDLAGVENAPNVLDRFWPMQDNGYLTPPSGTISFTYRDAEWNTGTNAIVESALQAQHFNGAAWSQPPNGILSTATNTLTTAPTSAFGFVWALVQGAAPLPVELFSFTAEPDGMEALCRWSTASESGTAFFAVERSADGVQFSDIGVVEAAGASNQLIHYQWIDHDPRPGLSFYRLRIADLDETERWSDVVPVRFAADGASSWVLWPTPTSGDLSIAGIRAGDEYLVLDAAGRTVLSSRANEDGPHRVDLSAFPDGLYTVQLRSSSRQGMLRALKTAR